MYPKFQNVPKVGTWFENKPSGNPAARAAKWFSFIAANQPITKAMSTCVSRDEQTSESQGCQMVYFHTKNLILGILWKALEWKIL
jgi:hypothetical protein